MGLRRVPSGLRVGARIRSPSLGMERRRGGGGSSPALAIAAAESKGGRRQGAVRCGGGTSCASCWGFALPRLSLSCGLLTQWESEEGDKRGINE